MKTVLYANWKLPAVPRMNSVRVAFLTSIRDVGTDDRNGEHVETRDGRGYMEGIIERFVNETRIGGALYGYAELALVITDDSPKDMRASEYAALPEIGRQWIHPRNLAIGNCTLVTSLTRTIPSAFRALPKGATELRAAEKRSFEEAVLAAMREMKADILVSDHYMARVDYLIGALGLYGKALNIHPAITLADHEFAFPGKTPTADAIARARQQKNVFTGATLHIMNGEIDKGPPVALVAGTPVHADDKAQWLRHRNYQMSKLPLFIRGLRHYIERIYSHLGNIDLSSLEPRKEK